MLATSLFICTASSQGEKVLVFLGQHWQALLHACLKLDMWGVGMQGNIPPI